jgi:hypothetical protein
MRGALVSGFALLLAACSGGSGDASGNDATAGNATLANNSENTGLAPIISGWGQIFADPATALAAIGGVSYRPGAYEKHGAGYRATGTPTPFTNPEVKRPNIGGFEASGSAERISRVTFTLDLTDQPNAALAKQRFAKSLTDSFDKLGVPGADKLQQPILKEKPEKGSTTGANYDFSVEPIAGAGPEARRLIVTFTPAAATAPATQVPEAQGK